MWRCLNSSGVSFTGFIGCYSKPHFLNKSPSLFSSGDSFSIRAMGSSASSQNPNTSQESPKPNSILSDDDLKQRLTPEQFYVTRQKGTERPFTGCKSYLYGHVKKQPVCASISYPCLGFQRKINLFLSLPAAVNTGILKPMALITAYAATPLCLIHPLNSIAGLGGPSYYEPVGNNVKSKMDLSIIFMPRQEVVCAACSAHLGHVFDNGPRPTGKRYCINSASLKLKPN